MKFGDFIEVTGFVTLCLLPLAPATVIVIRDGRTDFEGNFCWYGKEAVIRDPRISEAWCLDMCQDSKDFRTCAVDFCHQGYWKCK